MTKNERIAEPEYDVSAMQRCIKEYGDRAATLATRIITLEHLVDSLQRHVGQLEEELAAHKAVVTLYYTSGPWWYQPPHYPPRLVYEIPCTTCALDYYTSHEFGA